jgi:hypothetical protein
MSRPTPIALILIIAAPEDAPFAERVADHLRQQNRSPVVFSQRTPPDWPAVQTKIDGAVAILFILSPAALTSENCQRALYYAVQTGKWLIPCRYRDYTFSVSLETLADYAWPLKDGEVIRADENTLYLETLEAVLLDEDNLAAGLAELDAALDANWAYADYHTRLLVRMRRWHDTGRNTRWQLSHDMQQQAYQWLAASHNRWPAPTPELHRYIGLEPPRRGKDFVRSEIRTTLGCLAYQLVVAGCIILIGLAILAFLDSGLFREEVTPEPPPDFCEDYPSYCKELGPQPAPVWYLEEHQAVT